MSPADDRADRATEGFAAARLEALERQLAALTVEVARLRADAEAVRRAPSMSARISTALHLGRPGSGSSASHAHAAFSGDEIESLVGRYGTLLLAALVILMGVGVLVQVAVIRGLLTPEVRVAFGAFAAAAVGAAGAYFHSRGEVRYGIALLALALAVVELVVWGAGPRLHLISSAVGLSVIDVVAVALAALAVHDDSEFLFTVAVAGLLSAPFVAASGGGSAPVLLAYGACVLLAALRAAPHSRWVRALGLLVGGAAFYALAAAGMPAARGWYAPYLVLAFTALCAAGALLLAAPGRRGVLARAFLAVGSLGLIVGWDRMLAAPSGTTLAAAALLAAITYAALAARDVGEPLWLPSALLLPLLSLGVAFAAAAGDRGRAAILAAWAVLAAGAWWVEGTRGNSERGGAHLLLSSLLGAAAIGVLLWPRPLLLVAGFAGWGVVLSALVRSERSALPLVGVGIALGAACASAMDQLASRAAYAYVPFTTRSSASALCATAGLALGSAVLAGGRGAAPQWADRPTRLGLVVVYAILWGRMEVAQAFNRDVATFLLIAYYAACGVASIIAGRELQIQRLRLVGLALAIYAAVKALAQASEIGELLLRVGAYGAVGVFLLGAGYLYRERRGDRPADSPLGGAV